SRSSFASADPVEAPDGTDAFAAAPLFSRQAASTVGRPRLSRTSRPRSRSMMGIGINLREEFTDHCLHRILPPFDQAQHRGLLPLSLLRPQVFQPRPSGDPCQRTPQSMPDCLFFVPWPVCNGGHLVGINPPVE